MMVFGVPKFSAAIFLQLTRCSLIPMSGVINVYDLHIMTRDSFILISLMFLMTAFCRGMFAELVVWFVTLF